MKLYQSGKKGQPHKGRWDEVKRKEGVMVRFKLSIGHLTEKLGLGCAGERGCDPGGWKGSQKRR